MTVCVCVCVCVCVYRSTEFRRRLYAVVLPSLPVFERNDRPISNDNVPYINSELRTHLTPREKNNHNGHSPAELDCIGIQKPCYVSDTIIIIVITDTESSE